MVTGQVLRLDYNIVYNSCPGLTATVTCVKAVTLLSLHQPISGRSESWRVGPRNEFADVPPSPRQDTRAISQHIPSEFREGPVVREVSTARRLSTRPSGGGRCAALKSKRLCSGPGVRSRDWLLFSHHRHQSSVLYVYLRFGDFGLKRKTMEIKVWNYSNELMSTS